MRMQLKVPISIEFSFCVAAAVFLLVLPLRLVIAFVLATTIHELGHFIALRLLKVNLYSIRLHGLGIEMQTEDMEAGKEFLCSLAGPASGLVLLAAARYIPCTAVIAFLQSMFNLIPIYPLDGGRALGSLLCKLLGKHRGIRTAEIIGKICAGIFFAAAVHLTVRYRIYIFLIFIITTAMIKLPGRKIPCKQMKQIVQ